jgi:hypothetical protein
VQPPRAPVPIDADGTPGESREEERDHDEPRRRREARLRGSHGGFPQCGGTGRRATARGGWPARLVEPWSGGGDRAHFRRVRSSVDYSLRGDFVRRPLILYLQSYRYLYDIFSRASKIWVNTSLNILNILACTWYVFIFTC